MQRRSSGPQASTWLLERMFDKRQFGLRFTSGSQVVTSKKTKAQRPLAAKALIKTTPLLARKCLRGCVCQALLCRTWKECLRHHKCAQGCIRSTADDTIWRWRDTQKSDSKLLGLSLRVLSKHLHSACLNAHLPVRERVSVCKCAWRPCSSHLPVCMF